MAELLAGFCDRVPPLTAVTDARGAIGWADLNERTNRWIHLLRDKGLTTGDRVAVMCGNRREVFEAALACLHSGLVLVPINWHLTPGEVAYIVDDSGSRALIVDPERATTGANALTAASANSIPLRVVVGDQPIAGFEASEPLLAAFAPDEPADQCSGSVLLYTSGTSGRPKGVITSLFRVGAPLAAISGLLVQLGQGLGVPASGHTLLVGPWYHSGQMFFSLFPLLRGCPLRIATHFDPAELLDLIELDGITHTHLVPIHFVRLLRLPAQDRAVFQRGTLQLVWHGAAACPVETKRAMIDWWGPVFVEYYAATEGGIATIIDSAGWLAHPGSVGRAIPPTELRILDDAGQPLPNGTDGKICLRRPADRQFTYHNAPDQTRAAYVDDLTFTYGDVGHLDDDGYLYLTGRATDMVITGGINVYPAEVEGVLFDHPDVLDAAVFGVADEEYGERVIAAVVAREGAPGNLAEILESHCRERLAGFKVPRAFHLMPDLARDPNGKLRKHLLANRFAPASVS